MAKKKDYDNKKDFIIRVRVTPAEHNEFMKRAKEKGYKTVSSFIRSLIDEQPVQKSTKSVS